MSRSRGYWFFGAVLCILSSFGALARGPLTFEERVAAQTAIERVYYTHRIWPKENPQPKPPFEVMCPKAQIEAKVTDYLKKCAALEKFWQRPITAQQLQAEMDRMAKGSQDPAALRELFSALGNDPVLVAECLARPLLSDRLIQNWYGSDTRFHANAKVKAERALKEAPPESLAAWPEGNYRKTTIWLKTGQEGEEENPSGWNELSLDKEEFKEARAKAPEPGRLAFRESPEAFSIERTIQARDEALTLESLTFPKHPFGTWWQKESQSLTANNMATADFTLTLPDLGSVHAPEATADTWAYSSMSTQIVPDSRYNHTAVWTGTEMIVWGGFTSSACLSTGGRYNPSTDTWVATSTGTNCPSARRDHAAVWTGAEMIIWGGDLYSPSTYFNTGGRYNPVADSWVATSTGTDCPVARAFHTAAWTGSEMIVWGGYMYDTAAHYYNAGGRYSPSTDLWSATSTGTNCPSARAGHTAVWTGTELIIWGGAYYASGAQYLNTGGLYDPSTDTWTPTSTGTNCPTARELHSVVWTGSEMIVWGGYGNGYLNTGGRYNPSTDLWSATSTGTNCPTVRQYHTAAWTGTEMIIWGGYYTDSKNEYSLSTGGRYNPATDTWVPTSAGPSARRNHTAVWTGTEWVVWGGYTSALSPYCTNTGSRYNPTTDTWVATSCGLGPSASNHQAVWTGTEMIVWGNGTGDSKRGGRYSPATDTWTTTSTGTNCPSSRDSFTAVWTGTEMIIWGGYFGNYDYATGGRYNPSTDTWTATSAGANCPASRYGHAAVWTGTEMIVWGGLYGTTGTYFNTGGRYNPTTDTWVTTSTGINCPSARYATAVWTGTEMIVWGGYYPSNCFNNGGRYNPATDTWVATSTGTGCPLARRTNNAVWTGTEMIVWGGYNASYLNDGGRYNPSTDAWVATSTGANCPSGRSCPSIWTGTDMIVWGGQGSSPTYKNDGGRYDPITDTWVATSTGTNCPSARSGHTSVWTGTTMIIWGGQTSSSGAITKTGGLYAPYDCTAPSAPVITSATDNNPCTLTGIAVTYTAGNGATSYNLLKDALVVVAGYTSGATYCPGDSASHTYIVRAVNGTCTADSNSMAATDAAGPCSPPPEAASGSSPSTAQIWTDKNTQAWPAVSGANSYTLYRGTLADLPNLLNSSTDSCTNFSGASMSAVDASMPSANQFYWYLVTASNANGEGSAGNATAGARIVNSSGGCP